MKSYFAKLADRATLANVTASSSAYAPRVSDPFEEVSPEQTKLPPPTQSQQHTKFQESRGFAVGPPTDIPAKEPLKSELETRVTNTAETPTEVETLQPRSPQQIVIPKSEPTEVDTNALRPEPRQVDREAKRETTDEVVSLVPNSVAGTFPVATKESSTGEEERSPERDSLIDLAREQALLLHKADLFMSSLLEGNRDKNIEEEVDHDEPAPQSLIPDKEPPSRIEPLQRTTPSPVQEANGPSLVIGKLTVEIAPPTPPPAVSQPHRIVVRGSRGRATGVMSSRRFGLGQF